MRCTRCTTSMQQQFFFFLFNQLLYLLFPLPILLTFLFLLFLFADCWRLVFPIFSPLSCSFVCHLSTLYKCQVCWFFKYFLYRIRLIKISHFRYLFNSFIPQARKAFDSDNVKDSLSFYPFVKAADL